MPTPTQTHPQRTPFKAGASFDFDGARKAGYTDEEIADHLKSSGYKFDFEGARAAGYNDTEIVDGLRSGGDAQPARAPRKWSDVAVSPAYLALGEEDRQEARRQYFDSVVAPRVPAGELDAAWAQFSKESVQTAPQRERRSGAVQDAFLNAGASVNRALGSVADLAGANNPVSSFFRGNAETLENQLSQDAVDQAQSNAAELGATQGFGNKFMVGAKQAASSPLQTTAKALGYLAPSIATAGAGVVAGLGRAGLTVLNSATGTAMGAGAVKGGIYDTVKQSADADLMADPNYAKLRETMPEQQAKEVLATALQSYRANGGKIALGAIIGAITSATGAEGAVVAGVAKQKTRDALLREAAARNISTTAAKEAATEVPQEMLETALGNTGAASGGARIDPLAGVPEAGGQALVAGAAAGGVGGGMQVQAARSGLKTAEAPAAVDAGLVLDAEPQVVADAVPSQPPALPAPRVIVNPQGQAIREGSGQVFDEPAARVSGRADLQQAVREELQALGFDPTQRATPTPITVGADGQAVTDEQMPAARAAQQADSTIEPPAKVVGRSPIQVAVREELRALGLEPESQQTGTRGDINPDESVATSATLSQEEAARSDQLRRVMREELHALGGAQEAQATAPRQSSAAPVSGADGVRSALREELRAMDIKPNEKTATRAASSDAPSEQPVATNQPKSAKRRKIEAELDRLAAETAIGLAEGKLTDDADIALASKAIATDPRAASFALRPENRAQIVEGLREIAGREVVPGVASSDEQNATDAAAQSPIDAERVTGPDAGGRGRDPGSAREAGQRLGVAKPGGGAERSSDAGGPSRERAEGVPGAVPGDVQGERAGDGRGRPESRGDARGPVETSEPRAGEAVGRGATDADATSRASVDRRGQPAAPEAAGDARGQDEGTDPTANAPRERANGAIEPATNRTGNAADGGGPVGGRFSETTAGARAPSLSRGRTDGRDAGGRAGGMAAQATRGIEAEVAALGRKPDRSPEGLLSRFAEALQRDAGRAVAVRLLTPEAGSKAEQMARQLKSLFDTELVIFDSSDPAAPMGASVREIPNAVFVSGWAARPDFLVGHEMLHELRKAYPDLYGALVDRLREHAVSTQANVDVIRQDYRDGGIDRIEDALIEEENMADVVGRAFASPDFWADVERVMNQGQLKQLFRWIARWFNKHFGTTFKRDISTDAGLRSAAADMREDITEAYAEMARRNSAVRSLAADTEVAVARSGRAERKATKKKAAEPRVTYDRLFDAEPSKAYIYSGNDFDVLGQEDRTLASRALDAVQRLGVPTAWIDKVDGIFVAITQGDAASVIGHGNAYIELNAFHDGDGVPRIQYEDHPDDMEVFTQHLIHELAHVADADKDSGRYGAETDPEQRFFFRVIDGELVGDGPLAQELIEAYRSSEDELTILLEAYPFGPALDGLMDDSGELASELFAQSVVAYFKYPDQLKALAPQTHGALHAFINAQHQNDHAADAGAVQSAKLDMADFPGSRAGQEAGGGSAANRNDADAAARGQPDGGQIASPSATRKAALQREISALRSSGHRAVDSWTKPEKGRADKAIDSALWAASSAVKPVTVLSQAANNMVDAIGRAITNVTGLDRVGQEALDLIRRAVDARSSWDFVERAKHGLVSDFGLPEEYLSLKVETRARENKLLRKAGKLLERMSSMGPDQLAVAYQWLQEKPDTAREADLLAKLSPAQREVMQQAKQDIDHLSREALKLGLISPEVYERNAFAYVHRSYKKYEMELTDSQILVRQRAQRLKGDQFKGRGMEMETTIDRIRGNLPDELMGLKVEMLEKRDDTGKLVRREYLRQGEARPAALRDYQSAGVWEVRGAKNGKLKVWRDFTREERQRMGEIEDARYGFARTMLQGVRDVETARFLDWVGAEYARDDADGLQVAEIKPLAQALGSQTFTRDEWVKVPETKIKGTQVNRYGTLAGKYVPGVMWNDLMAIGDFQATAWDKMLTAWKLSKTALSPAVHVNNVMSNFIMADLADVGVNDIRKALNVLVQSKRGDDLARSLVERYQDSGAEAGSFAANEMQESVIEPLLQQIAESEPEAVQKASLMQVVSLAAHGKLGEAAVAATKTLPARGVISAGRGMIQAYQAEDSVFRLAKFIKELDQGATDVEAGKAAKEAFLDYSINAPWIRTMRRTALPFISFTYRAAPLLAKNMATKPWKFAKYLGLGYGLSLLAYGMLGAEGDEEKEKRLLPDEMQGTSILGLPKMIRMPWNDKDGDPVWLDVRRWLPGADIAELNNEQSAIPLPSWLSAGGTLALAVDLFSNTDRFGDEIVAPTDSATEAAEKVADHIFKWAAPNLPLPGPGAALRAVGAPIDQGNLDTFAWVSLERAYDGARSIGGNVKSMATVAPNVLGVKVQDRRLQDELASLGFEYQKKERDIKANITRIGRQGANQRISSEEMQRRISAEVEKLQALGRERGERMRP
jgi:hypothetical protein